MSLTCWHDSIISTIIVFHDAAPTLVQPIAQDSKYQNW
uniref:Uncharacterized protein n=1 Tax=Arundo donax TaxID=35708 RepID=A0A0A9BBH5_ARUDO